MVVLVACGIERGVAGPMLEQSTDSPAADRRDKPPPEVAPSVDPLFACTSADDCVLREVGCCDICNGGTVMAFAASHQIEGVATYAEPCELMDTSCTLGGWCDELAAVPVCAAGTCARLVPAGVFSDAAVLLHNEPPPFSRAHNELWGRGTIRPPDYATPGSIDASPSSSANFR